MSADGAPTASIGRPTDGALWASVETTLRRVVLPAVGDSYERQVVIQLIGLAAYAGRRGSDPTGRRASALAAALDGLAEAGNEVVAERWSPDHDRDAGAVMRACADVLAATLDADDAAQGAARDRLRPLLLADLEADIATEQVLLGAFRGKLPDG